MQKQLIATIDGATTLICLEAAGQIRDVNARFDTLNGSFFAPPFHIHCRSVVAIYMKGVIEQQRAEANTELRRRGRTVPDGYTGHRSLPPAPVAAPDEPSPVERLRDRLLGWLPSVSGLRRAAGRLLRGRRDRVLEEMLRRAGADGPPQVVSRSELVRLVQGGARPVWRGITGPDAAGRAEQLRSGPLYVGLGIYGNGVYVTSTEAGARRFAGADGVVVVGVLLATAVVVAWPELEEQVEELQGRLSAAQRRRLAPILADPGRVAAALGYQAVLLPNGDVLVLDRAALAVAR
ncbi:hypothetical protein ACFXGA_06170 [Actinosynnema sp. NPDC059335]|uniref:hypothetical protein n=1 Tax=Actinosynnema sp. NPDC059335 TaxID=3346804 RepID=UPI00366B3D31